MSQQQSNEVKLCILVRKDLDKSYRMVQGMHSAVIFGESLAYSRNWKATVGTIVCYLVRDEVHLMEIFRQVPGMSVIWREPDLDNQATSIAFLNSKNLESILEKLPLA